MPKYSKGERTLPDLSTVVGRTTSVLRARQCTCQFHYLIIRERQAVMAKSREAQPRDETPPGLDFSKYSFSELGEIKRSLENEMQSRQAQEVEALLSKVTETAQSFGLSVEEMLGLTLR